MEVLSEYTIEMIKHRKPVLMFGVKLDYEEVSGEYVYYAYDDDMIDKDLVVDIYTSLMVANYVLSAERSAQKIKC